MYLDLGFKINKFQLDWNFPKKSFQRSFKMFVKSLFTYNKVTQN